LGAIACVGYLVWSAFDPGRHLLLQGQALVLAGGMALALAAAGLWYQRPWGWMLALLLLCVALAQSGGALSGLIVAVGLMRVESLFVPDRDKVAAERELERAAGRLGIGLEDNAQERIDEQIAAGDIDRATKLYRESTGVSWDEAYQAVALWDEKSFERKLLRFLRRLSEMGQPISQEPGRLAQPPNPPLQPTAGA
jgi:hypothetical protein